MNAKRLAKHRQDLARKPPLIGGWLWQKTVEALAADGSPEAVQVLVETVARNRDGRQQRVLMKVIGSLICGRRTDPAH